MAVTVFFLFVLSSFVNAGPITFNNGGYDGIVVSIGNDVPAHDCRTILDNLEVSLTEASQFLYDALDGRAFWRSLTVLLPDSWPDNCLPQTVMSSNGETPDINIGATHPVFGNAPWTQQSMGCGQPGDGIYLSYRRLNNLGRLLVQQWAKYRYGVFDEFGYNSDNVYPTCYQGDNEEVHVTGCSDLPIQDMGACDNPHSVYNISGLAHPEATSSIMFAPEAPHVSRFCDSGTHNRYAPTKHNLVCDRRSTMEVILQHPDFVNNIEDSVMNTTPMFHYKRWVLTRYVLVIEDTRDMLVRESWSFLRLAVRKWAGHDLLAGTEVGVVLTNDTAAYRLHPLTPLSSPNVRNLVSATIPYTPGDSHAAACLHCGVREALDMLYERSHLKGPASSIIIVIAPGMDRSLETDGLVDNAIKQGVRICTINYPGVVRHFPLDQIAYATDGMAYTVQEQRYNMADSYISTYFRLSNVLFSIGSHFYQGSQNKMLVEIHQRELSDDLRSSVRGSFVLDESLGEPARFTVFTHNIENPLIKGITLVSPSQVVYTALTDSLVAVRLITISANINETGTWTYTFERFSGNPQPHFVQVMATPRSATVPLVHARAWVSHWSVPLIVYTEVKRGSYPVLAAKVEVTVVSPASNGSTIIKEKFELFDNGGGDPDLTKGDGVYARYFNIGRNGLGIYTFEVTVTDNGNTAYSWQENLADHAEDTGVQCCGNAIPTPAVQPLVPFQRVLPPISVTYAPETMIPLAAVGRIGDLRVEIIASDLKARLTWTAPDLGGLPVARYEVRYAMSVADIIERFDAATPWNYGTPFPLAPGSETSFTLDFTRNPSLLDVPMFVAIRGFSDSAESTPGGPVSNWVHVLVPSPPPPPPPPSTPITSTLDLSSWPYEAENDDTVVPRIARDSDISLELILPIVGGVILLMLCIAVYCYVCVLRRRNGNSDKKDSAKGKHSSNGKQHVVSQSATVTIVPSSPVNASSNGTSMSPPSSQQTTPQHEPQFDSCTEEKKRFSIAQLAQEEQMLQQQHQEMLQQQQQQQQQQQHVDMSPQHHSVPPQYPISTISAGNPGSGGSTMVRGRTLSPYQSWTASQLLHEHERRHSPYGGVSEEHQGQLPPPVPPLPSFTPQHNGVYSSQGPIYGVHPGTLANSAYHRNGSLVPFNPSLQGSLSSVSSGDRKKRNVTMV